jgi:hypothetical protein
MKLKFFVIIILSFANTNTVFSQATNCNDLKAENIKIKQENEYLKKTLGILQPIQNLVQNEVELKIVKVDGSIIDQTVTFILYITNHKANDYFQFATAQAIDVQGKEYNTGQIFLGNGGVRNKLFTDTPLEVKVKFSKVLPSTKIFKVLNLESFKTGIFNKGNFEYKDLEINWQ